jgi:hypothetical protein
MSDGPARRSRVPPAFESLAFLYQPADPAVRTAIIEADEGWGLPPEPAPGIERVIWGRLPRNERPSAENVVDAARRELSITRLRVRPPHGFHIVGISRLPPVRRPGVIKRRIRRATLGGILVELARAGSVAGKRPTRVIDAVVSAAGGDPAKLRVRPSGDGSALARLTRPDGTRAELRVAKLGHTKDPARGHAALVALADAGVPLVPRPLGSGVAAGAAWSAETVVSGRHVQELDAGLLEQVIGFAARLPAGTDERRAVDDQIADVIDLFPEHASALTDVAAAAERWGAGLPSVLIHGDLWLNNVFTVDGRLTGVFDWDTWHPAGLPGTDLLNLLAADTRTRERRDIGDLLVGDYWRSTEVVDALARYFRARGWPMPDAAGLAAIATGWWVSRIAGALDRALRQVDDPAWTQRNIADALPRFEQLDREFR